MSKLLSIFDHPSADTVTFDGNPGYQGEHANMVLPGNR
jgi:hypothetical protein